MKKPLLTGVVFSCTRVDTIAHCGADIMRRLIVVYNNYVMNASTDSTSIFVTLDWIRAAHVILLARCRILTAACFTLPSSHGCALPMAKDVTCLSIGVLIVAYSVGVRAT